MDGSIVPLHSFAELPRRHFARRRGNGEALLPERGLALGLFDVLAFFGLHYAAHPFGHFLHFVGAFLIPYRTTDLFRIGINYLNCRAKPRESCINRFTLRGDYMRFTTGNGEKLSYSQAADLAWLCLVVA